MRSRTVVALSAIAAMSVIGLGAAPAQAAGGTTYTWIGSSTGDPAADTHDWQNAHNWSPMGVPGDGDSAIVAPPSAETCFAHLDDIPTGVDLVNLDLHNTDSCLASLNDGSFTISGAMTWDGGEIDAPITLNSGSSLTISGTHGSNSTLAAPMTSSGAVTLNGPTGASALSIADVDLTITSSGSLASTGPTTVSSNCCNEPVSQIVNNGTFHVSGGTTELHGVRMVQNHALVVDSGSTLLTDTAPQIVAASTTMGGAGTWQAESDVAMSGTQTFANGFHFDLGDAPLVNPTLSGTMNWNGTGEFDWQDGIVAANLSLGPGLTTLMNGTVASGQDRTLYGQAPSTNAQTTLTNHGHMLLTNGAMLNTAAGARLTNASNGIISLDPGTGLVSDGCCVHPDRLSNVGGLIEVTSNSGSNTPVTVDNVDLRDSNGTLSVPTAQTLDLIESPSSSLASTTITGGGHVLDGATTAVSGTVTVVKPTQFEVTGPHGALNGTATVGGSGVVIWSGGSLSGLLTIAPTGGTRVIGIAAKNIYGYGTNGAKNSTITFAGPTRFYAGSARNHDIVYLGSSTLALTGASTLNNMVELNNGTLRNSGTETIDPGASGQVLRTNYGPTYNDGTMLVQTGSYVTDSTYNQRAGTTTIAPSATFSETSPGSHPLTVLGGTLAGGGTVNGAVNNASGVVAPGTDGTVGTLTVTGAYTQRSAGALHADVSGPGVADLLSVGGNITMVGTLLATNVNGYSPALGDQATIATAAGTYAGSFSCAITAGTGSTAGHWAPSRSGTSEIIKWVTGQQTSC